MAKTFMEKLGLEPVRKLTKKTCLARVRFLDKGLRKGRYRGKLEERANYYLNWYSWMAKNGGTRASKKKRKRAA